VKPQGKTTCRIVAPPSLTATSLPRGSKFSGSWPASDFVSNSTWPSISTLKRIRPDSTRCSA
jgi:hypothetical protein